MRKLAVLTCCVVAILSPAYALDPAHLREEFIGIMKAHECHITVDELEALLKGTDLDLRAVDGLIGDMIDSNEAVIENENTLIIQEEVCK